MIKTFRVSFSSAVDVQAKNEEEARAIFHNMSDEEIGATVEEYDNIKFVCNIFDEELDTGDCDKGEHPAIKSNHVCMNCGIKVNQG